MHIASPSHQIKILSHASGNAVTGAPKFMALGGKCVYVTANAGASESCGYVIEALIKGVPKTTGEAWAINALLYWDNTAGKFTTTAGSNAKAGYAAAVAGSADTTGDIHLISLNAV